MWNALCANRGCSEIYHMPLVDYKNHKEGMPYELKFPFRPTNNNAKWPRSSSSPRAAASGGTLIKAPPSDSSDRNSTAIPRSVSSDGRPLNPKRSEDGHESVMQIHQMGWIFICLVAAYVLNVIHMSARRYSPGNDNYALACSIVMGRTLHSTNSPSNLSYTDTISSNHWRQKHVPDG